MKIRKKNIFGAIYFKTGCRSETLNLIKSEVLG